MTPLPTHPHFGWTVDPDTGHVFGSSGRHRGRQIGCLNSAGYLAAFGRGRRQYQLHRAVWEACVGPIPQGMVINHINGVKTDNRLANLEVVTPQANAEHAWRTGLMKPTPQYGPANANYKVTPEMREQILSTEGSCAAVGRQFGVSAMVISRIRRGLR